MSSVEYLLKNTTPYSKRMWFRKPPFVMQVAQANLQRLCVRTIGVACNDVPILTIASDIPDRTVK